MKRINRSMRALLAAGALLVGMPAHAAGGGALPYGFEPDLGNEASLQRGARNFMNYCSGCHSMQHLRYSRVAEDLNIPLELLQSQLMFTSGKPGEPIRSAMPADSASWFGAAPPDLTLETRMRGPAWVYSYLMTFYTDPSRPLGTNNLVLSGASMPNVLGQLQGIQIMEAAHAADDGHGGHAAPTFRVVTPGALSEKEFARFVADTVNFMVYAAEPGRLTRVSMGIKVMLFLVVFTVLAYLLKREYWKDVH